MFGIMFGIGGPAAVHSHRLVHAELPQAPQPDGAAPRRAHGGDRARHGNSAAADRADRRPQPPKRRRSSLLPGLVWFFIGLASWSAAARIGSDDDLPVFVGLIPLGIGLAYLIYYFVEGRHVEARWLEQDLRERADARPADTLSGPATL